MQLTLKYNEHATQSLSGAFIRGNTPGKWLQEINTWQIPLEKLVCFIIAQNNNPADAAGLFVVFNKGKLPGMLQVMHPYTVLGGKLYLPVNAELSPAISEQELQSLLIWDYQVFHPAIGFIGFEKADRINLADLLQYREPRTIYWGYAQAGLKPWIPLNQIGVVQLTAEEVFDSYKDQISNKPLTDIPKSNKGEVPGWLNNPFMGGLFKGTFAFINWAGSIIPTGSVGSGASGGSNNENPGLFTRFMNWMEQKIEDLERQRDSELKRLMDLFEKDTDEALQYAIPLDSPYMNRGTGQASANLTRRSTKFNLGSLGGGRAVDGWNVDKYYSELRAKYLKAAQTAIGQKDFKKAAYIYAQLMGDYNSAADTLRRGKYYREAAALYKEHLKNLSMAAICYEEGGLLTDAIEIYTDLNQHEKAGDLYRELGQEEPAINSYEKSVAAAAVNKDYLEESRIIIDKIGNKPRAKKVLLNGWNDVKQPEACLVKYFDLAADENKEEIHSAIRTFYANNLLVNKEMAFLNVIDKVNQTYKSPELESTCQGIAYEIVSEQVSAGNPASLHALTNFVPGDQLLTPDCYRFMHTFKEAPKQKPAPDQWQLMADVKWKSTLTWHNQLLIWGVKPSGMVLARMNWDGYIEYFTWNMFVNAGSPILAIANPAKSNHILICDSYQAITEKWLPRNKHFQEGLVVSRAGFITTDTVGIGFYEKEIVTLEKKQGKVFLNYYHTVSGELKESILCNFIGGDYSIASTEVREMIFCDDQFYWSCNNGVLCITKTGEADLLYEYGTKGAISRIAVNKGPDGHVVIAFAKPDEIMFITTDINVNDPFQIVDFVTVDMIVLPGNRFAVASKHKVEVYDLTAYLSEKKCWEREFENEIIAVFPGPNRDQIGVLESKGKITLQNVS